MKNIKQVLSQSIKNSKKRVLSIFDHENFTKFIVLSRSRTGSNLLISMLNSHPNISAEGEKFSRLNE
mgnify:CR=1 FL=1